MSTEENKALAHSFCAVLNNALAEGASSELGQQDRAILSEILTAELCRSVIEGLIPQARGLWGDHRIEITEMIAEGDQVWAQVATSGGHTGEWRGVPPTGRRWTNTGVLFIRIEGGKIAKWSGLWDEINHLKQLGAVVVPVAAQGMTN